MNLTDRINEQVRQLPKHTQAEVLNFVEYLLEKARRNDVREEQREWSRHSLSLTMREMEDEDGPEYTPEDLEERFSSS